MQKHGVDCHMNNKDGYANAYQCAGSSVVEQGSLKPKVVSSNLTRHTNYIPSSVFIIGNRWSSTVRITNIAMTEMDIQFLRLLSLTNVKAIISLPNNRNTISKRSGLSGSVVGSSMTCLFEYLWKIVVDVSVDDAIVSK